MGRNNFKERDWVRKRERKFPRLLRWKSLRWGLSRAPTCVNCHSQYNAKTYKNGSCMLPWLLGSGSFSLSSEYIQNQIHPGSCAYSSFLNWRWVPKLNYPLSAELPLHKMFNDLNCFNALNITNILISKVAKWGPVEVHCCEKFMFLQDCLSSKVGVFFP